MVKQKATNANQICHFDVLLIMNLLGRFIGHANMQLECSLKSISRGLPVAYLHCLQSFPTISYKHKHAP